MQPSDLQATIERFWAERNPDNQSAYNAILDSFITALNSGTIRAAEPVADGWQVNEWVKKGILLLFGQKANSVIKAGDMAYFDKVPFRADWADTLGVRVVPPAFARAGAHLAKGVILMPSFVNIGAYVGENTMVDTWATVGSCAQIGRNVHLSGGVGIGGVLEPLQAAPVIIEDGAFLGSRAIVVEGVRVGKEAVLGANVVLTASTKIIDVTGPQPIETKGYIPERSVVIPGTTMKSFPAGSYGVPCALIIGKRKASTDLKTSLNDALRANDVSV